MATVACTLGWDCGPVGDNDVNKNIDGKKNYNQPQGRRRGGEERYGGGKCERMRAAGWGGG